MSGGTLPKTGIATLSIGGLVLDETRLITLAVGLVLFGAMLVRFTWRRRKGASAR